MTSGSSTGEPLSFEELERIAEEQAALRRIATLVAQGAAEDELAAAVTSEIGHLFEADRANTMRLDGDTIRVIGAWSRVGDRSAAAGLVFPYGGDTTTARIVATQAPARVDSAADLRTELARRLWAERGLHASIGAPVVVDGTIWGAVTAFRTQLDDPFPPGAEKRLHDFAALVAQAIVNAEARRETAALVAEQTALRHIATLVAAARPQAEVLDAVTAEAGRLFGASTVTLLRPETDQDGLVVLASCGDPETVPVEPGSRYHPAPGGATLMVLETGCESRSEETSPEHGRCSAIVAPVIISGSLHAVLAAFRPGAEAFPEGTETRLRSFADLAAQSIANARAQADLRASRAEADARVAEAEADIRFYDREVRRDQALLAKHATTPQNLDVDVRGLELARARRDAALAGRDRLDALIAKTRSTAPIDGVVTARHVQLGEIAEPGRAVVTIADLNQLRIEAEVDEFDAARVELGSPVTITAEGCGPAKWHGTVEEIPDSVVGRRTRPADPGRPIDARVLPVKIALSEPTPLKLGQRIDVEIACPNPGTR